MKSIIPKEKKQKRKRIDSATIKEILKQSGTNSLPEVAEEFINLCGGAKKFAAMLHMEYTQAPKGMIKTKLLDLILNSMRFAYQVRPKPRELDQLNDEDLSREIEEILAERDRRDAAADRDDTAADAGAGDSPADAAAED